MLNSGLHKCSKKPWVQSPVLEKKKDHHHQRQQDHLSIRNPGLALSAPVFLLSFCPEKEVGSWGSQKSNSLVQPLQGTQLFLRAKGNWVREESRPSPHKSQKYQPCLTPTHPTVSLSHSDSSLTGHSIPPQGLDFTPLSLLCAYVSGFYHVLLSPIQ